MKGLDALLERIINTVPMSEYELWALKGATKLGDMVYGLGYDYLYDIACTVEDWQDDTDMEANDVYEIATAALSIEQHEPEVH